MIINKIKDFIYDKSDIVIALLILVIAAVVILWRVDVILDYPKTLVDSGAQSEQYADDQNDDQDDAEDVDTPEGEGTEGEGAEGDVTEGDAQNTDDASGAIMEDGVLTREITVNVKGNSATQAIQCLIDKGIFDSYQDYKDCCKDLGLNDEKVSGGSFTFAKGMTKNEIAKAVNWS